jgi:hypothetical protein
MGFTLIEAEEISWTAETVFELPVKTACVVLNLSVSGFCLAATRGKSAPMAGYVLLTKA